MTFIVGCVHKYCPKCRKDVLHVKPSHQSPYFCRLCESQVLASYYSKSEEVRELIKDAKASYYGMPERESIADFASWQMVRERN